MEKMLTPEEMSKLQKSRTQSDAELLNDGAEYAVSKDGKNVRLDLTKDQKASAKLDMDIDMETIKYKVDREYYEELTKEQLEEIKDREYELLEEMHPKALNHLIQQMATTGCGIDDAIKLIEEAVEKEKTNKGGGYNPPNYSINTGRQPGAGTVNLEK